MTRSSFLETALEAVHAAEQVIMSFYKQEDTSFQTKKDNSPVTLADKGAEAAIKAVISRAFPDHGFIGEEEGSSNSIAEYRWIIDPIDGTKNFIRKIPLFTTELALVYKGELIVGVSNNPVTQEIYFAQKDAGAYVTNANTNTKTHLKISNTALKISEVYLSYGGIKYFDKINKTQQLLKLSKICRATRSFGESLHYRFLAQGKIDVVLEADARIWDIAAEVLICQEAGAIVTDFQGNPFTLDTTSLIVAHPLIHQEVVQLLNS